VLELIKTPEIRSKKEKTFLKISVNQRNNRNKRKKLNKRNKKKKINTLTIDQQISCFAEIICTHLLKEMNFYEKD
jgi:hypothetical protein